MVPLLPAGWGYLAYHCAVAFLRVQTGNHSEEVATWAGDELKTMGVLTRRVDADWPCIAQLRFVGIWQ